jgi:hypothetical protein
MGTSIYTISITRTDASTFAKNVVLSEDQIGAITNFINHINQFTVGCTAATITKLAPATANVPIGYEAWKHLLETQLALGGKKNFVPALP